MATSTNSLHAKLDSFWEKVQSLSKTSSEDEIKQFADYLHPDCTIYLSGQSSPPSHGHAEAIAAMKALTQYWSLENRNVISRAASDDGLLIMTEMSNRLGIMGETIDNFAETEVVQYDSSGLIKEYRLYCDPNPIMKVVQSKMASA